MKRWPTKPLGELLKVQNGFAFKSELFNDDGRGLPIIRIRDLSRGFSETYYNGEHDSAFEVEKGDFLIGMDGEFRCYRWQGGKALLNQRVCRLQNFSRDLNASYVFYGINEHLRKIEECTAFVTVKHLSSKQIASIEMTVPPLAEQERIVKLLDEADELQKLRAQADTRTAALLPALFNEMFGNPKTNSLGWKLASFEQTFTDLTARSPKLQSNAYQNEGRFPIIDQGQQFIAGYTDDETLVTKIPQPVVIFGDHTRAVKLVDFPFVVGADGAKVLVPQAGFDSPFLASLMLALPIPNLGYSRHMREVKRLSFIQPPLPLQKEFAQRVTEIRELEAAQSASCQRLEALFQSMLHRAFNGEL